MVFIAASPLSEQVWRMWGHYLGRAGGRGKRKERKTEWKKKIMAKTRVYKRRKRISDDCRALRHFKTTGKKVRCLLVFECCSPGQRSLAMQEKPTVEKSKSSFPSSSPFSPFLLRPQSAVPLPSPPPPLLSPWGLVYQYKQNYPIEKRREKWGGKVRAKEGRERR